MAFTGSLTALIFAWTCLAAVPATAADYAKTIHSARGLLVHYSFEERDNRVEDASAAGRHGELVGSLGRGVDSAFAGLGRGIRLSGGHIRVPELGEHKAVSIELWLNLAAAPVEGIAGLYAADRWQPSYFHFNGKSNGSLELAINGASSYPNTEAGLLVPGKWTHWVATYDSETGAQQLYLNGRKVIEEVANPRPTITLVNASIGAWINGNPLRPLTADIDEFAVYSAALSPGEVRRHYQVAKSVASRPVDFASQIQPLLARRCYECHGPETQESQMRLDVRDWALRGGESGEPALLPYDADNSHLVQLISSTDRKKRMPPDDEALTAAEIALLRDWIDQGAPWPDDLAKHAEPEKVTTAHWSFQLVSQSPPPKSDDPFVAGGNTIDAFVFAKLAAKGLKPSPEADRRTLIRRLYLDMHGLPPTAEEVRAFAEDPAPDGWRRVVERVLASPRYGERWASHWLDVVRYGDTHGFEVNTPRDNAWPYRDYVIKSLNEDKPYNQFLREQIAGDQLGVDAATGFLVAAPALLAGQVGKDMASMRLARVDALHEMIVSVGAGVLGVTIGCARCHNHKFDPISQRDYYQLQAFFSGVRYGDRPIRKPDEVHLSRAGGKPATTIFGGTFSPPDPAHRLYRGDPMQRRERVAPDVPAVFGSLSLPADVSDGSRRQALADWLADSSNPLTTRVIVNRLWQHHFGTGIVATPSDFGAMGFRPSHPELLDWLAASLVRNGWSLKAVHRLIVRSNTYRQSSAPNPLSLAADANAELLWRFPPRRLEMEPIRDSILAVSGSLDLTMGGPGFMVFKPNDNYVRVYDAKEEWGPGEWRRMIYAHRVRMAQDGVFGAFDCPDAGQPTPRRSRSTTALQSLNLLNSNFIKQQSELLAARAKERASEDLAAQVAEMFGLVLAREPSPVEHSASLEVARQFGAAAVARALFNSNEFLFLP